MGHLSSRYIVAVPGGVLNTKVEVRKVPSIVRGVLDVCSSGERLDLF